MDICSRVVLSPRARSRFVRRPAMILIDLLAANVDRPLIDKAPPLDGDCHLDPNIKALRRRGFSNQGSRLIIIILIILILLP